MPRHSVVAFINSPKNAKITLALNPWYFSVIVVFVVLRSVFKKALTKEPYNDSCLHNYRGWRVNIAKIKYDNEETKIYKHTVIRFIKCSHRNYIISLAFPPIMVKCDTLNEKWKHFMNEIFCINTIGVFAHHYRFTLPKTMMRDFCGCLTFFINKIASNISFFFDNFCFFW